jgi:hypothetical protein
MNFIITRIFGGLGNQMFQYAMGRALAYRNNAKLLLDISFFARSQLRRFALDSFSSDAEIASGQILRRYRLQNACDLLSVVNLFRRPSTESIPFFRERFFHFDPVAYQLSAPVCIEGYWQSARYFEDCAPAIRQEFKPKQELSLSDARLAEIMTATPTVSLHVRRGDYVTNPRTNATHGLCSLDYYARAMEYITERVDDVRLFVFSDDLEWTQRHLSSAPLKSSFPPTTFVEANPASGEFRDMHLMSCCKHHIIANSSYSWWGAWLNPSPDEIIVCPQQWFRDPSKDTRDLTHEEWIQL